MLIFSSANFEPSNSKNNSGCISSPNVRAFTPNDEAVCRAFFNPSPWCLDERFKPSVIYNKPILYMEFTELHYEKPLKIYKQAKEKGYDVKYLSRGVAHFEKEGKHIVSLKGTDPLNITDLKSDLGILLGKTNKDEQFKERKQELKHVYKSIPQNEHINLVAHSLGGSLGTSILSKSKSILQRTNEANFYNTGYTKALHKELKEGLIKEDRQELNDKITHHIIKDDLISQPLRAGSIGKVVQYDSVSSNPLTNHSLDAFK